MSHVIVVSASSALKKHKSMQPFKNSWMKKKFFDVLILYPQPYYSVQ